MVFFGHAARAATPGSPLELSLSTIPGQNYVTGGELPVHVIFYNKGKERVRLFNAFADTAVWPVFFSFRIEDGAGTPVTDVRGGGKADFIADAMHYVDLDPEQGFFCKINLEELIESGKLPPNSYSITVTYHNQYGEECFQGELVSEPLNLTVEEAQGTR